WRQWSPNWHFDDACFERTAIAHDNPDYVDVVIHSYRHRFGLAEGDPQHAELQRRLAELPPITVPTITLDGDADGVVPPTDASAGVAAHPIEEKASAKVASRDDVWRRWNWLRLACTRNQSWIEVADTAPMMTPDAVTAACDGEAKASASTSGAKMTPIAISTTSILARMTRAGRSGAVATRSAASSPDIVSQARPPAS